jgi:hypothetical protein
MSDDAGAVAVAAAAAPQQQPDRPVSIQVGGRTFACRLSTLSKHPDALLWKAYTFNNTHFDLLFWDRNARVFECLLDFYRTNRLNLPPDMDLATIREELGFWGFDLGLPERPPWPVVPSFFLRGPQGLCPAPCPLGLALRESSSGCHLVLLMLIWSAMGRCASLWEAAQRGHRSICVYWKTRAPGMDSSLLRSHFQRFRHLAEMDGCSVEMVAEVPASNLSAEVRGHDVYTHGHVQSSAEESTHVAEWRFPVRYHKDGHQVVFHSTAEEAIECSFDVDGFRISLHVLGDRIWWYMNPIHDGEERSSDGLDVRGVWGTEGFLLEVSFVVNKALLSGFALPSSYYRTSALRADMFVSQRYAEADTNAAGWYLVHNRRKANAENHPFDFGTEQEAELVLLVERRHRVALVCHPVNNIVPFSSSVSFSPCVYDRLRISW